MKNSEIHELRENILELEKRLNELSVLDEVNSSLTSKVDELTAFNEQLKVDLALAENKSAELLSKNEEFSSSSVEIEELRQFADNLNSEKIKLEETITDLKRELFKAEEELSSSNLSISDEKIELNHKIEALKNESLNLKVQKEELEKQVSDLLKKLAEYGNVVESQKNDNNLEKLSNSANLAKVLAGSIENKRSAKLKINELLREIDRCIAALNAQS
ncbi:MAG: hypothetical protein ACK5D5_08015 [Bacteroidota bacterium]